MKQAHEPPRKKGGAHGYPVRPEIKLARAVAIAAILAANLFLGCDRKSEKAARKVQIAVAANFTPAMESLAEFFEKKRNVRLLVSSGSTGNLYTQIKQGAPYDLFFAADVTRPKQLEAEGIAVPGTRFTYAVGQLVLWSPRPHFVDSKGEVLVRGEFQHLALANPQLAPYGRAAQEVLVALRLWGPLKEKFVQGENVIQAYHFVKSGNAELGFLAFAQIHAQGKTLKGSTWEVPQSLYAPIEQQAVLLKESAPARAFLHFVRSREAQGIIRRYGYKTRQ